MTNTEPGRLERDGKVDEEDIEGMSLKYAPANGKREAVTEQTGRNQQEEPASPITPANDPSKPANESASELAGEPANEPISAAAILAQGRTLRMGLVWVVIGALALGLVVTATINPKTGAYYFGALLTVLGTLRLILPGAPFGISARSKLFDVAFYYAFAAAIFFLATSSSALRCTDGLFC